VPFQRRRRDSVTAIGSHSVCPSICVSICVSMCVSICPSICVSICVSVGDRIHGWRSGVSLETKLCLYNICILPIYLYGAETWPVTATLSRKIDSLDNWCLRRILNIHWTEFVTDDEVRSRTGQPLLSDTVRSPRLSFFGHLNRADPCQDHYRALQTCTADTPAADWRRRPGRPRQSRLRTVETDLRPLNLGLASAKRRTQDRAAWRRLVGRGNVDLDKLLERRTDGQTDGQDPSRDRLVRSFVYMSP